MKFLPLTLAVFVGLVAIAPRVFATDTILHNFTANNGSNLDGAGPGDSLTLSGSKLYGMASSGGSSNRGTLFSINTNGTGFTVLHTFTALSVSASDGAAPFGSLTISGSKLYGMTLDGGLNGLGTIFSMNTDGTSFSLLRSFGGGSASGSQPTGSLTLSGSKLYGMTYGGGTTDNGTIFSINTDGTGFGLLHSFSSSILNGRNPSDSLTLSGSKLFGMTPAGGSSGSGTVFSINTDGTGFSLLHSFTGSITDGSTPYGSLTLLGSKVYGTTSAGGSSNKGTVFSMNTDGTGFSLLHSFTGFFTGLDGDDPRSSLTLSGSKLYGMTSTGGQQ